MKWPWSKREARETSSYTSLLVDLALQRASGSTAKVGGVGVLQAASGLTGRAFAAATVEGPDHLAAGVTPECLSMSGRALMRSGEIVFVIEADDGGVRLAPVAHFDIRGGVDPRSWIYRCTLPGPSETRTVHVPSAGVVHLKFETDPDRPWRGIAPLESAALAGRLSSEVAASLADQESGPRGSLVETPKDGADPTVAGIKTALPGLRGRAALVESGDFDVPGGGRGMKTWNVTRLGAAPPAGEVELLTASGREVAAALGCSGLFDSVSNQGAARELLRRWLHTMIAPLGRVVSAELSLKLEGDVSLDFTPLMASDIQGRARAWRSLVGPEAAMTAEAAGAIVGFEGE